MNIKTLVLFFILFYFSMSGQNMTIEEKKLESAIKKVSEYKLEDAETELEELIKPDIEKKQPKIYIRAQLNLGRIYGDKAENVKALQHYQKALKTAERTNDQESLPHIFKNIGVLYVSWKKFDDAFRYYDKAEQLAIRIRNKELIADCQNNKGIIFEQKQDYQQALKCYKNALSLYSERNLPGKISMALSNIAIVYKYQKNYQEAINYNTQAIAISEKQNDKWSMAATYNNIGNLYGEMGDYKKAITFCNQALKIAKEINAGEIIESTYDSMANAAAKAGDYKKAFEYHKLFSSAMNDFINEESTKQLSELNVKYETEKKQSLINQQQFEIKQKNNWLIFTVLIFLISVVTAFFIYRNFRYKQQAKLQKEIFLQKEIETKALFEGEQKERIRIARDIHDSVGQMLSLVAMNISAEENQNSKNIHDLVNKTIAEVRTISHNLIPEELNFGLVSALENLSEKINSSSNINFKTDISSHIKSIKIPKQNEISIYRVIQEIVNNMIKHSGADKISLTIDNEEKNIIISIRDNGKGLDALAIEKSVGMGWKNIKARVNMMDGNLKIDAGIIKGTHIQITLPKNG